MFKSHDDLDHHVTILNDIHLHPNIVQTERIIFDEKKDRLVSIMERMDGCLEGPRTPNERTPSLRAIIVLAVARDIIKALEHLARMKIVHGDLKPENILYRKTDGPEEEWTYKLADFDGAVKLTGQEKSESKRSTIGTPGYVSPERLNGNAAYPFAGDIWSLGVTLHVLRYGRLPFPSSNTWFQVERFIMKGNFELSSAPEGKDPVEKFLHEIIQDMLPFNPAQRVTATDLLKRVLVVADGDNVVDIPSDATTGTSDVGSGHSSLEGGWIDGVVAPDPRVTF